MPGYWHASIGLFNSKCVTTQRAIVKVSMAFIFYCMSFLLLKHGLLVLVSYFYLLLTIQCVICISFAFNDTVCNLYFNIALILLLWRYRNEPWA